MMASAWEFLGLLLAMGIGYAVGALSMVIALGLGRAAGKGEE